MNILIFKKYAINSECIEQCKNLIEKEFSVIFEEHESSYSGQYFRSFFLNSNLSLFNNYNEIEDHWTEPDFKMLNTILSVSISGEKKRERLDTDDVLYAKLTDLNFRLVSSYEKEVN